METEGEKKNGFGWLWLVLLLPVVAYIGWRILTAKDRMSKQMEKVREAKAAKAAIDDLLKNENEPD